MKFHKSLITYARQTLLPVLLITAVVILLVSPSGCKGPLRGMEILQGDFEAPHLVDVRVCDSTGMRISFDKSVRIVFSSVQEEAGTEPIAVKSSPIDGQRDWSLSFAQATSIGRRYVFSGVVEDEHGNTLSFQILFSGYNDDSARMVLAEIRNAYSSKKQMYEYISLYCLKGGNLAGYELVNAGDGERCKFVFPAVSVEKGDFVTVHLRMMKQADGFYIQSGMINETDGDKGASYAVDSSDCAWDFWMDNEKSRLFPSDIIILRNTNTNTLADVFLFTDPKKQLSAWKATYGSFCTEVEKSGIWLDSAGQASSAVSSAFLADGITNSAVTRTMCRKNITELDADAPLLTVSADDWYVKRFR